MRLKLFILLSISLSVKVHPWISESLRLNLPNLGSLLGRYMTSSSGRGIKAFIGIPFAEPPIGDLRFRDPVPNKPWNTELDATGKIPRVCSQINFFNPNPDSVLGDEDCLYLNVYVPVNKRDGEELPVMVWYHGCGWQIGYATMYGPEYFLDHDVILVTTNYRLGVLGFLSTGQEDCHGNFAFKDQILALKWVKENIRYFGGDPEQVTIFGDSGGSATVTYLMASPLAKGLFKRGIAQSGTTLSSWAQPQPHHMVQKNAEKLGKLVGCPKSGDDWKGMVSCLRTKSDSALINAFWNFLEWSVHPAVIFSPAVEADHDGAFLTQHPRDIKNSWGDSIDFMTGVNLDEGLIKSLPISMDSNLLEDVTKNYETILPLMLFYHHFDDEKKIFLSKDLHNFYMSNSSITMLSKLTQIVTDSWFVAGMNQNLQLRFGGHNNNAKTFVYLLAHRGDMSLTEFFNGPQTSYGVCHNDILQYLFPTPFGQDFSMSIIPSDDSIRIRKAMVKYWVEFARSGLEACEGCTTWEATTSFPLKYMRFGRVDSNDNELMAMETGFMEERSRFWNEITKNYF